MNLAEKAALAKQKAIESKVTDKYHEAEKFHASYYEKWNKVQEYRKNEIKNSKGYKGDVRSLKHPELYYDEKRPVITIEEEKNLKRAKKLYTHCAKAGHADSMEKLAFIYDQYEGDKKKSFKWYKAGAERGNVTCMHNVGVCYQDGEGVKASFSKAQYWFEREKQEKK